MRKKKVFCLHLEKCWYPASHYKKAHLLLFCCCNNCNCGMLLQKSSVLLSTLQKKLQQFCAISSGPKKADYENPSSSVVAEPMKFLANSSYGYQIIDRSRNTVTKYLTEEKTHAVINNKLLKKLDHVKNSLYEVQLSKSQIEQTEPIIVGFFYLQYAKLRILDL